MEPSLTAAAAFGGLADIGSRLTFFKNLQSVTNKIHATTDAEQIITDLSPDICDLFGADRLTIYAISEDKTAIVSKVKVGLGSFKDLRLPIAEQSIAGYVALHKLLVNISDVYDEAELKAISPNLRFLQEVDQRTGYRTKQQLVCPVLHHATRELLGVVQLINNRRDSAFPPFAEEGVRSLCDTLAVAFDVRRKPLGARSKYDHLVASAILTRAELDQAMKDARGREGGIEEVLIDQYQVKPAELGICLAKYYGVPYEPFRADRMVSPDLLKNLKRDYVEGSQWIPLEETSEGLMVMTTDPEQTISSRVVPTVFPRSKLNYRVTTRRDFLQQLEQCFGKPAFSDATDVGDLLLAVDQGPEEEESSLEDTTGVADNELVKLVNKIVVDAYQQGASDIHIEPGIGKDKVLIRFRRDGSLVKYFEVPSTYRASLVARIKIMCDLDISERRRPQDGKIKFKKFGPLDIELRVATIPSTGGVEDVVMRILAAGDPIPLEKLDVLPLNLERLKACISKPYGLFFVCGPTGSGKTTTLHSILKELNTPDTKIWTAEDPVEITQKGLRQVQINKKAGLDFATIMRAFLRADPDIIMVGEMRDAETTSIGIEASLTGHLVFATLHTNSAPESVIRLLDMGMDPFNFADALLGVLAQRLAKRLCQCKQPYVPDEAELQSFLHEYCEELALTESFKEKGPVAYQEVLAAWKRQYGNQGEEIVFQRPVGCEKCGGTGYRGRIGLHELMVGTEQVKKLIQEHARVAQLFTQALTDGMLTLKMDGMNKVLMGLTDIKQVRAVCIK